MIIDANKAKLALQFPKALDALVREYDIDGAEALDKIMASTGKERFTLKFVNGVWVVFDNRFYLNVEVFMTEKLALKALA